LNGTRKFSTHPPPPQKKRNEKQKKKGALLKKKIAKSNLNMPNFMIINSTGNP
jgi:hypothetical protein